jgi:hypothetical protein
MHIDPMNVALSTMLAVCVAGCACSAAAMSRWHNSGASALRALACNLVLSAFCVGAAWTVVAWLIQSLNSEEQIVLLAIAGATGMLVFALGNVVCAVLIGRSRTAP